MRLLVVTAVSAEAAVIHTIAKVIVAGVGRTNAAAATTEALLEHGPFDAVISAGVAGVLPGSDLDVGNTVVASECIYAEEGLVTRHGFANVESMGLSLGDFAGNSVPVDPVLLESLSALFPIGPIATVATCSGTDDAAAEIVRRTGAVAEAMEGAAVVHAARRLRVPAIELRTISNRTGARENQGWNLEGALQTLGSSVSAAIARLAEPTTED